MIEKLIEQQYMDLWLSFSCTFHRKYGLHTGISWFVLIEKRFYLCTLRITKFWYKWKHSINSRLFQDQDKKYIFMLLHKCPKLIVRPSLKKCHLGVTSVIKKWTGGKGIFIFLGNIFKYSANVVHTNIWFPEREREIRQF